MRRLTGFDAQFVFDERANDPQHTFEGPVKAAARERGRVDVEDARSA